MRARILAIVAVSAAAGCIQDGSGGLTPGLPQGPQYSSAQTIYNALTNFSVVGSLGNGTAYCEYHAPNGQIVGNDAQGAYTGTWAMAGDQICYTYPLRNQFNVCMNVIVQGSQVTTYYNGQSVASGNLVGGNFCGTA